MSVSPDDVLVELGRPTPATTEQATQLTSWINQALYLIGKRLGDVSLLDQADVDYVVLMSVADHARQPEGVTQVDIRVDDGAVSKRYATGAGRVTIADYLWALLDPDLTNAASVGSTQMYGEPDTSPWPLDWT